MSPCTLCEGILTVFGVLLPYCLYIYYINVSFRLPPPLTSGWTAFVSNITGSLLVGLPLSPSTLARWRSTKMQNTLHSQTKYAHQPGCYCHKSLLQISCWQIKFNGEVVGEFFVCVTLHELHVCGCQTFVVAQGWSWGTGQKRFKWFTRIIW